MATNSYDDEEEPCVRCGIEIIDEGIIYVRDQVNGKWGSHPICTQCWYKENPNRLPVRCNWKESDD